jgi:type III pantothenate kinase
MEHLIALDIGNTNITAGVFARDAKGWELAGKAKIPSHSSALFDGSFRRLFKESGLDLAAREKVVISSVVPLVLARAIVSIRTISAFDVSIIGRDIKVPIKNLYKNKAEVGQDRLVDAYAAKVLYGAPAVIVDFGSAITFDVVSRKGAYLGGLILPGIEMGLASLYRKTALLPKVELRPASDIIGTDTVSSMRGGILFGYGAMCDGLVRRYKSLLGRDTRVVATGGNASLMKRYASSLAHVDEDLTLKGILRISQRKS